MSRLRVACTVFPGSNCDHDVEHVVSRVLGHDCRMVWHKETSLGGADAVVVPGGFSYGDYLRCGAIARFSPIMDAVIEHAQRGGPVIGICNGFQILTEAGLLPGALLRNAGLRFLSRDVHLRVENDDTPFTRGLRKDETLRMPIAHMEGNYFVDEARLAELRARGQVVFRYATPEGQITREANPNGSLDAIAGVVNERGNVLGLMPHPDRAAEGMLGSTDGRRLFECMLGAVTA